MVDPSTLALGAVVAADDHKCFIRTKKIQEVFVFVAACGIRPFFVRNLLLSKVLDCCCLYFILSQSLPIAGHAFQIASKMSQSFDTLEIKGEFLRLRPSTVRALSPLILGPLGLLQP